MSPLSADASGTLLNINADTVAAALASALGAAKLVLATGAAGHPRGPQRPGLADFLRGPRGPRRNCEQAGALADGMLPKARAIEAAIRGGVPRVHVISYKVPDSLLLEIFTNEGTGHAGGGEHQHAVEGRAVAGVAQPRTGAVS